MGWKFYRVGTRFLEKCRPLHGPVGFQSASGFSEAHDAFFCQPGDVWIERSCDRCEYCWDRPSRPSKVKRW